MPLSRALVILQKEATGVAAKTQWKEVHDLVVDGLSLANAMAKFPVTFPRVYTAMVEAGEAGGFLDGPAIADLPLARSRRNRLILERIGLVKLRVGEGRGAIGAKKRALSREFQNLRATRAGDLHQQPLRRTTGTGSDTYPF